jgi:hypothetical protein
LRGDLPPPPRRRLSGTLIGLGVGVAAYVILFLLAQATESSSAEPAFNGLALLVAGGLGALAGRTAQAIRKNIAGRR